MSADDEDDEKTGFSESESDSDADMEKEVKQTTTKSKKAKATKKPSPVSAFSDKDAIEDFYLDAQIWLDKLGAETSEHKDSDIVKELRVLVKAIRDEMKSERWSSGESTFNIKAEWRNLVSKAEQLGKEVQQKKDAALKQDLNVWFEQFRYNPSRPYIRKQ